MKQRLLPSILLLVLIAYLPCLHAGFVNWDDDVHVLKLDFTEIWTSTVNHTYIPLTSLSWAMEHRFFGFNPFIFHLDNILLHLAVTGLVFAFSRQMGLSSMAAALAALLFGIHPIHVESVAWVTERKDVLYGVFYMGALLVYLKYLDSGRRKYWGGTLLLGVLSILAKPMALSLPLTLLILDWFFKRKGISRIITEKAFCAALLMPIAFVSYFFNSNMVQPSIGHGAFIWIWCFVFYLYKFLFPWPLVLFYGFPHSGSIFYLSIPVFIGLLGALWLWRQRRLFVFAIAFYLVNIFFLLKFYPFLDLVSDRFMYIPSVGICMLLAASAEKIFERARGQRIIRPMLAIGLGALLVAMSMMTWRQCEVWQSSVTLWEHQLEHDSKTATWLILCKLADAYSETSKPLEEGSAEFKHIRMLYEEAIALKPQYPESYRGLGRLYESAGDKEAALMYFRLATQRNGAKS